MTKTNRLCPAQWWVRGHQTHKGYVIVSVFLHVFGLFIIIVGFSSPHHAAYIIQILKYTIGALIHRRARACIPLVFGYNICCKNVNLFFRKNNRKPWTPHEVLRRTHAHFIFITRRNATNLEGSRTYYIITLVIIILITQRCDSIVGEEKHIFIYFIISEAQKH